MVMKEPKKASCFSLINTVIICYSCSFTKYCLSVYVYISQFDGEGIV